MYHAAAVAIATFVTATLAVAAGPASELEKGAAANAYLDCMLSQAASMDDGTSDAETIGRAIAPACRQQMGQVVAVFGQGQSGQTRDMLYRRMISEEGTTGAAAVLKVRRTAARASQAGAPERQ
jgi:hypothetical protein